KYKNTQETVLFDKRNTLFGLNNLKQLKAEEDFGTVIMVEGYMDVISLYQAGFKNVVASMGTSLTKEQVKILKRYTDKVVVSYDGDGAGQKATIRSLDLFENEGFDLRVATLPNGLDPDDVIKQSGAKGYQQLIDNALPLADYKLYLIKKDKDFADPVSRRKFVTQSITYLRTIANESLREELLLKVRDISGISYASLKRDLENGTVAEEVSNKKSVVEINKGTGTVRAERFILASVIFKKPYAEDYDFCLTFTSPHREKIADALSYDNVTASSLYDAVGEEGAEELTVILSVGENVFGTAGEERYYNDCVKAVKKANLQVEIAELNKLYKEEISLDKKQEIAELIQIKNSNLRKIK
ncbi:MAG: toprim domain-containing protein, partial [Clostridia bacterium]|nr:toprim domain-containing protein [Clostridia bacterium]